MNPIYSLGHSNLPIARFIDLLRDCEIEAVADVRSSPFSGRSPHFNQPDLKAALKQAGMHYVFLGKELGGRPRDTRLLTAGVADYEKMAVTANYQQGIRRLVEGAKAYRIALVCSERDPLDCHRCLLVGRSMCESGYAVHHIRHDGSLTTQSELAETLLSKCQDNNRDMFIRDCDLATAYRKRSEQVAYREKRRETNDKDLYDRFYENFG